MKVTESNTSRTLIDEEQKVLGEIFTSYDRDGNKLVDSTEFLSGLLFMTGGEDGSCVKAAFSLYDIDDDGYITKEEMFRYLKAVFSVTYGISPHLFQDYG